MPLARVAAAKNIKIVVCLDRYVNNMPVCYCLCVSACRQQALCHRLYTSNGTDVDVLTMRCNSDGTYDGTFGTNGVVTWCHVVAGKVLVDSRKG